MISFSAIRVEVIARLGNRTDISSRVVRWINYSFFELLLNPRFSFFELDVIAKPFFTTVANVPDYALPVDLWFLLDVRDDTNERKIRRYGYAWIDMQVQTTGQPIRYYRFGDRITLDPIPDAAYDITLRYRKRPPDIADGSNLLIGTEWEEVIIAMAAEKGFNALDQKDKAVASRQIVEQLFSTRYDVPNLEDADSEPTLQPRYV